MQLSSCLQAVASPVAHVEGRVGQDVAGLGAFVQVQVKVFGGFFSRCSTYLIWPALCWACDAGEAEARMTKLELMSSLERVVQWQAELAADGGTTLRLVPSAGLQICNGSGVMRWQALLQARGDGKA